MENSFQRKTPMMCPSCLHIALALTSSPPHFFLSLSLSFSLSLAPTHTAPPLRVDAGGLRLRPRINRNRGISCWEEDRSLIQFVLLFLWILESYVLTLGLGFLAGAWWSLDGAQSEEGICASGGGSCCPTAVEGWGPCSCQNEGFSGLACCGIFLLFWDFLFLLCFLFSLHLGLMGVLWWGFEFGCFVGGKKKALFSV